VPQDYCADPKKFTEIDKCSKVLTKGVDDEFKSKCQGKNTCTLNIKKNLNLGDKSVPGCVHEHAKLYLQYQCKMDKAGVQEMRKIGVVIACVMLILAALFNLMMQY
jgi:hypothetical protein